MAMTSAPQHLIDVPPFQLQKLITDVIEPQISEASSGKVQLRCAQAMGSEIYAGCSNGELVRFALQADGINKLESYQVLSRQALPGGKPVDEIVLIPSLSRALVLSDHQIHFYTLPSLDPHPWKPIRNAITMAVDDQQLRRPFPTLSATGVPLPPEPVDFCVIKRNGIALFTMKERLTYTKEVPIAQGNITLARRSGKILCLADKTHYNMLDLEAFSIFQVLPISQAYDPTPTPIKPSITVIGPSEFLILSWTGASTLGVFVTGDGDPVRGTLEWPDHPESICLDYPYITSLLPNNTIEIHSVETQAIVQVVGAPARATSPDPSSPPGSVGSGSHRRSGSSSSAQGVDPLQRLGLVSSIGGYLVPSTQRSDRLRTVPFKLLRT